MHGKNGKNGFTLIELMITIIIVAVVFIGGCTLVVVGIGGCKAVKAVDEHGLKGVATRA